MEEGIAEIPSLHSHNTGVEIQRDFRILDSKHRLDGDSR